MNANGPPNARWKWCLGQEQCASGTLTRVPGRVHEVSWKKMIAGLRSRAERDCLRDTPSGGTDGNAQRLHRGLKIDPLDDVQELAPLREKRVGGQ